jgi:inosine triphosphate pyrophosphatase
MKTNKPKLAIVTGNPLKFRELSSALCEFFDCEQKKVEGFEIQGTLEEILSFKLDHAYKTLQMPVLVDDTALYFEALGGFPGPYAKDFFDALTPYQMGEKFDGSRVDAVCSIGLKLDNDKNIFARGKVSGVVVKPDTNDHDGREFDLFFKADGCELCMINYSPEEKNKYSHRGNAIRDLVYKLKEINYGI